MTDSGVSAITVRGNRPRLLVQAIMITVVGALGALALQRSDPIGRSPLGRLDASIPIPLVFVVVTGLAVAIAVAVVKDSWSHHVELRPEELYVRTARGAFIVPYEAIADVKQIPWYGVGIVLTDPDTWLQRLDEQPGSPTNQRKVATVLRTAWGVDIGLLEKNLAIGSKRFTDLLRRRLPGRSS